MLGHDGAWEVSGVLQPAPSTLASMDEHLVAVPARSLAALCDAASAAADVLGDVDPCDDALVRTLRGTVAEVRCHALAGI